MEEKPRARILIELNEDKEVTTRIEGDGKDLVCSICTVMDTNKQVEQLFISAVTAYIMQNSIEVVKETVH